MNRSKPFLILFAYLILFITFPATSYGAIHYVSPAGTATWVQSTSISTPCSIQTAFSNAAAGDTVYFRGGTYTVPARTSGNGTYNVANSGSSGSPIIFQAYPGETPLFDGQTGGNNAVGTAAIFGIGAGKAYITFDGFSFIADGGTNQPLIYILAGSSDRSNYLTIKNCTFNGGSNLITSTDNRQAIFVEYVNYMLIQKCKIYNYKHTSDYRNTSGYKGYHNTHTIIENCEFYNNSTAIFLKSDEDDVICRYNYIHDCSIGILITSDMIGMETARATIHNNVIINCTFAAINSDTGDLGTYTDDLIVYNNTFYHTIRGISTSQNQSTYGVSIYNNIVTDQTYPFTTNVAIAPVYIKEADHNQWGPEPLKILIRYNGSMTTYTTLANWQASTQLESPINVGCGLNQKPGCGDLSSNAKFVNGSGNLNQLSDFRLASASPCKGAGRNGADMGANIDLIVLPPSNTPPVPPKNLKIVQ